MIFSAVKQEFTISPYLYLDSGLKQTWKFLINVPKFLFEGNCLQKFEGRNRNVPKNLLFQPINNFPSSRKQKYSHCDF